MLTPTKAHKGKIKLDSLIDCTRFSSYLSILRTTAFVLRFFKACLGQKHQYSTTLPNATELDNAEKYWIKCIQANSFREEIECLTNHSSHNSVRIIQFGLFLDNGILRCKGRINNSNLLGYTKSPVLLPSKHMYVTLLIRHFHEQIKHNGVDDTLAALRERYWILRGRRSVKSVLRSCVICLKLEGLPYLAIVS